jgi:tRNA G18 (ribose-2'-O)-methylase SpoU
MKNRRHKNKRTQAEQRYQKHRQRNILAEPGVHDFVIVLDHLKGGFNVPKIFRSAQAFGAREIHLVNVPWFDPAPAKGAFKYVPAIFHENFESCHQNLSEQGYTFFILEPNEGKAINKYELPKKSAFIFGNEELGISFQPADFETMQRLTIQQFGPVDSLNVSVAASIVMYEYTRQTTPS